MSNLHRCLQTPSLPHTGRGILTDTQEKTWRRGWDIYGGHYSRSLSSSRPRHTSWILTRRWALSWPPNPLQQRPWASSELLFPQSDWTCTRAPPGEGKKKPLRHSLNFYCSLKQIYVVFKARFSESPVSAVSPTPGWLRLNCSLELSSTVNKASWANWGALILTR